MRNIAGIKDYRPVNFWKTVKKLFKEANYNKPLFAFAVFLSFLRALCFTGGTWVTGKIVDLFLTPDKLAPVSSNGRPNFFHYYIDHTNLFFIWLGFLFTIFIIYALVAYFQMFLMIRISNQAVLRIRNKAFNNLQKMHIDYYDTRKSGDLISRLSNDVDSLELGFTNGLTESTTAFFNLMFSIIFMAIMSVSLTLISVFVFCLLMIVSFILLKKLKDVYALQQKSLGEINAYLEEIITNKKIVSSFQKFDLVAKEFEKHNHNYFKITTKSNIMSNMTYPNYNLAIELTILVFIAISMVFYVYGIPTWGSSQITAGFLLAFINLLWNFGGTINDMLMQSINIILGVSAANRVFQISEMEPPHYPDTLQKLPESFAPEIEFKNVYFRYNRNSSNFQTKNVSFKVKPNQMIALVGPTGAGKTTIINLLTKFYDIEREPFEVNGKKVVPGDIYINGIPYSQINSKDLRNHMSIVLQDTFLFKDTIKNNIIISQPNATYEDIKKATQITKMHDKIKSLPDGYNSIMDGESSLFSKGQNQLLDISRVILSNNNIVIFDEATSNLDTKTEKQVYRAMDQFMKNKTSFVIAHRLSTIVDADLILVIDDGQIVEQGSHDELLKLNGVYSNMYNTQMDRIMKAKAK